MGVRRTGKVGGDGLEGAFEGALEDVLKGGLTSPGSTPLPGV